MNKYPQAEAPRIVKPRQPKSDFRYIIAISRDWVLVESAKEEVFPIDALPGILANHPSAILVVQGFGEHLQRLQRIYGPNGTAPDPNFNYRLTPIERYSRPWNSTGKRMEQGKIVDSVCNFVGWKADAKHKPNRYHYPIDPLWFLTTSIDDLDESDAPRLVKLYRWAKQVRDWTLKNDLQIKASAGGLAAQLLRDPRFYPEARRKVPRMINEVARFQLPGNYYRFYGRIQTRYKATYIDMENAHHEMAKRIQFPNANDLYAFGDWSFEKRLERNKDATPRPFAEGKAAIIGRSGLHYVRLSVPNLHGYVFAPPYMEREGKRNVYVYSNELELIESLGGKIECVYASFSSATHETGLNRYAKFAIENIKAYADYKPWLKPVLHSTYGLLAARPTSFETGYLRSGGGTRGEYHMGNVSLPAQITKRPAEIESRIANVIHRGMIEAEVRCSALRYAAELQASGHRVLAIYADAIFTEDRGRKLPSPPRPWRISKRVTNLRFHSAVHFTSPQLSRLPGVPRTARQRFLDERELVAMLNAQREARFRPTPVISS